MVRILAVSMLVVSGLFSIVSSASAEDGGQYYMGRGNVAPESNSATLQR